MQHMKPLVVAAVLLGPAVAHAQPGNVEPQPFQQPPYAPRPVEADTVDPDTALGLSLGGTVASWAMLIVGSKYDNAALGTTGALGTLLAPSFGHWYAHDGLTRGLGLRLLGLGAGAVGLSMALDHLFDDSESAHADDGTIAALMIAGIGLYAAGTIDDIATAPSAAHRYNARFEVMGVVPTMSQHGGGFALAGRF
jgi:hypothetical protein